MALAAGAVRNFAVAAPIALLNMTTEGRGAADRNRPQRLLLLIRERISKRRQVSRASYLRTAGAPPLNALADVNRVGASVRTPAPPVAFLSGHKGSSSPLAPKVTV